MALCRRGATAIAAPTQHKFSGRQVGEARSAYVATVEPKVKTTLFTGCPCSSESSDQIFMFKMVCFGLVSESQISEGEAGGNCFCSANTVSHQPQQSVGTSMKSNRYPRNSYASAYPNLDDYTGDELEEDNAGDTDGDCCEENDCREVCAVARESSHGGSQNWSTAYANDSQTNQSMDNGRQSKLQHNA